LKDKDTKILRIDKKATGIQMNPVAFFPFFSGPGGPVNQLNN